MAGFELQEWIDAPAGAVFESITSPDRAPEIMPHIVRLEKLTAGPLGAGARLRETRLVNGQEAQTELQVRAYEPPHTYVVSAVQSGIEVIYRYTLRPEEQGTAVHLQADVAGRGLRGLMAPLVARIMQREDGHHLAQLKTALEASA